MITLDGCSLTIEQLTKIARDPSERVTRDAAANERVAKSEALIRKIVEKYRQ
jgi:histidine ammonia-lyase